MERNEFIEGFGKISSDCNRMTEKHDIHYMIDNTSAAPNVRGRKTLVIIMEELAELNGTIDHEILCNINRRVPRVYIQGGKVVKRVEYLFE